METRNRFVTNAEFGEVDDPEWVSLYPEDRSLSPIQSPRQIEASPEIQPVSGSCRDVGLFSPSSSRVLRRKHANVGVAKQEERRRRLGKRKSFVAPEDGEEVRKQENLRHRKKAFVLEKKLGTMTSAIEELNSTINLMGTDSVSVLPYADPGESSPEHKMSFPNETLKPVRSKRKVFKRHGWTRGMRRMRKPASVFFACFFCFIMLFFPIKLGLFQDEPAGVSNPMVRGQYREFPRLVREIEGSNKPGKGTSVAESEKNSNCQAQGMIIGHPPKTQDVPGYNDTSRNITKEVGDKPKRMQQPESSVFTAGKCTQVFEYNAAPSPVTKAQASPARKLPNPGGNPVKLQQKRHSHTPPRMVVSILPNKSSNGEVFVMLVVDGTKYITYSCSLPKQIAPGA